MLFIAESINSYKRSIMSAYAKHLGKINQLRFTNALFESLQNTSIEVVGLKIMSQKTSSSHSRKVILFSSQNPMSQGLPSCKNRVPYTCPKRRDQFRIKSCVWFFLKEFGGAKTSMYLVLLLGSLCFFVKFNAKRIQT